MSKRFGYWRDAVIRKHNWNKKRPFYESLIKSLEPPKKRRKRKNRVLKNGQWVRKERKEKVIMSTEKDREVARAYADSKYGQGKKLHGDANPICQHFLAGIQHARQGEREAIKIFAAKFLAFAMQLGFIGYPQWSDGLIKFLEREESK